MKIIAKFLIFFGIISSSFSCFNPGEEFDISFKLSRGDVYKGELELEQTIIQESLHQKFERQQNSMATVRCTVKENRNNNLKIEIVFEDILLNIKDPLIHIKFDSKSKNNEQGLNSLKDIINKKIIFMVSGKGEIQSIEGINEVLNSIIKNNSMNPLATATALTFLNEQQIRNTFIYLFNHLPNQKVSIGDTWSVPQIIGIGTINYKTNNKWKLLKTNDDLAYLNLKAKITGNEVTGEQNGDFELNRLTGWVSNAQIRINIPKNDEKQTPGINSNFSFQFSKTK